MLSQTLHKLSSTPRNLFLLDGFGALLSAFLLGFVLVKLESIIGMPAKELYFLAALPCFFAIYDFWYYFNFGKNWRPFLKGIAMANLLYCILSASLIFYHFEKLTSLGLTYFLLEIGILIILIAIEFKATSQ